MFSSQMKENKWEMKAKRISLYLTFFPKQKKNMWECEIIIICEKLKNIMRNKIRNNLINIFILHYIWFYIFYLLTLNATPYKINRKIAHLTSINFQYMLHIIIKFKKLKIINIYIYIYIYII